MDICSFARGITVTHDAQYGTSAPIPKGLYVFQPSRMNFPNSPDVIRPDLSSWEWQVALIMDTQHLAIRVRK